jgi:uncharacterized protein (UPF0264 family)
MRLLVSVRSASEVEAAVAGGADIVDAKEPARGPLGAVDAATLGAIAERLPEGMALSIALGDHRSPAGAAEALALLRGVCRRPRELYVKVGLAGVREAEAAHAILAATVAAARAMVLHPEVVAVAYADHELAEALPPEVTVQLAAASKAGGVLLDTWVKDGRDLFSRIQPSRADRWVRGARELGLLTALAGSLSPEGVARAARLPADIVGVRGAACLGGRTGAVDALLVHRLVTALRRPSEDAVPAA